MVFHNRGDFAFRGRLHHTVRRLQRVVILLRADLAKDTGTVLLDITEGNSKWILFSTRKQLQEQWKKAAKP